MAKQDVDLVEKFVDLEEQIVDLLREVDIEIDFSQDRKKVMSQLKSYITKVKKVDKLFEEYEKIAVKIEESSIGEEDKNHDIACAVVDLREDSEEIKTEIENIQGQIKVKQVKKKSKNAVREL